jgi:flavin-dependent dehydrogenase
MTYHDVVVIGGSLAGSACIRELERRGIDAVAFERDRFPRNKVCGGFLSATAVADLDQLGVLEEVRAKGAVPIQKIRVRAGKAVAEIPFRKPGMGISRASLDNVLAGRSQIIQGAAVRNVERRDRGFVVGGESFEVACRIVIDAAGKLSRFTKRQRVDEFGVQYHEPGTRGDALDFWFFPEGYGGAVSVEGNRSNFCFLIKKEKVSEYIGRPDCLVTGPLAYEPITSDYVAIGDATGMVDPFCGEGMRHALETASIAAESVARGLRLGQDYSEVLRDYGYEWQRRWARRRAAAAGLRSVLDLARKATVVHGGLLNAFCRAWMRYSE